MNVDGVKLADITVDTTVLASHKSSHALESASMEKMSKEEKEGEGEENEGQGAAAIPKPPPLPPILGELGPGRKKDKYM